MRQAESCIHCVLGFSIVQSWETNAIGHPLILPLTVCEELLQAMEDTNALLPSVLRHMRSYQVRGREGERERGSCQVSTAGSLLGTHTLVYNAL